MEWLLVIALIAFGYWLENKLSGMADRIKNIERMPNRSGFGRQGH